MYAKIDVLLQTVWPVQAHLYMVMLKFLHSQVPECTLIVMIFDWLPRLEREVTDKPALE